MNQLSLRNKPVDVQDCRKITDHFRGIYRIYPNLMKETQGISTCNRMDLQTLGSLNRLCPSTGRDSKSKSLGDAPWSHPGSVADGWWQPHPPPPAVPSISLYRKRALGAPLGFQGWHFFATRPAGAPVWPWY